MYSLSLSKWYDSIVVCTLSYTQHDHHTYIFRKTATKNSFLSCFPLFIQYHRTRNTYILFLFFFVSKNKERKKPATATDGASTMQNKKKYFICIPFDTRWFQLCCFICSTFFSVAHLLAPSPASTLFLHTSPFSFSFLFTFYFLGCVPSCLNVLLVQKYTRAHKLTFLFGTGCSCSRFCEYTK